MGALARAGRRSAATDGSGPVGVEIVGWVDYDTDRDWLGPHEVNVGYNVFAPYRRRGYATRAVRLLLGFLRDHTDYECADLVIDAGNIASLGVARALGAQVVQSTSTSPADCPVFAT